MTVRVLASLLAVGVVLAPGRAAAGTDSLIAAVRSHDAGLVRTLIAGHADVNAREVDGTTALHWAVRDRQLDLARTLLSAGADAGAANRYGVTPLSLAAAGGSESMIDALMQRGADIAAAERTLPDGQTLLMLAARAGNAAAVSRLAAHGDVNAHERRLGTTALMWAAQADRGDVIAVLLRAGADVNARSAVTQFPHTPPAVVGDKLEEGVSYVGQTVLPKGGWTALMYAARDGALSSARALAGAAADLNAVDPDGTSALIFAIINGHYDVAALLVEKGADPNLPDSTGMTPLYAAVDMHTIASTFGRPDPPPPVLAGSVGAAEMLLAHGANPNVALKTRILKRVYNGGDPKLGEGATPFMRAARAGDATLMRILLDHGADPKRTQKNGNTPIILAASINARGINADRATERGAIEAITLCLDLGIDVNASNGSGDTAAHLALGSPAILQLLADRGARFDLRNRQGRTPLDAALANRDADPQTVALLRRVTPGNGAARVDPAK
jgi:ankyrin repeat protein